MFMGTKLETCVRLQVAFHELDPMQVVWHGNYLKYFDAARQALFEGSGLDLYQMHQDGGLVFPVTRSSIKHIRSLRFRDTFDVYARVVEATCRIVLDFEIRLAKDGTLCAKGRSEQVAVRLPEGTLELRLPDEVRRALDRSNDES